MLGVVGAGVSPSYCHAESCFTVMLGVVMLSVIKLTFVMLIVLAPFVELCITAKVYSILKVSILLLGHPYLSNDYQIIVISFAKTIPNFKSKFTYSF